MNLFSSMSSFCAELAFLFLLSPLSRLSIAFSTSSDLLPALFDFFVICSESFSFLATALARRNTTSSRLWTSCVIKKNHLKFNDFEIRSMRLTHFQVLDLVPKDSSLQFGVSDLLAKIAEFVLCWVEVCTIVLCSFWVCMYFIFRQEDFWWYSEHLWTQIATELVKNPLGCLQILLLGCREAFFHFASWYLPLESLQASLLGRLKIITVILVLNKLMSNACNILYIIWIRIRLNICLQVAANDLSAVADHSVNERVRTESKKLCGILHLLTLSWVYDLVHFEWVFEYFFSEMFWSEGETRKSPLKFYKNLLLFVLFTLNLRGFLSKSERENSK